MVGEIELEQIWHLRNVQDEEECWEFSVNYKVPIEDSILRSLLQGETGPPLRISESPELLRVVRVLLAEIRGQTDETTVIQEGSFSVQASQVLVRLMRKPTSGRYAKILICIGDLVGPNRRKLREFQREFSLDELSSPSQGAVHRLDQFATETAYRIFGEKAGSLDGYPPEAIPTIKKVAAFVAYRRTHGAEARRLYEVLLRIGAGTLFAPFIDHHDMQLGNWKGQILRKIESADVFVAVVSPDYAETGTFGLEEFVKAKEVAANRGWNDFFAPVFIGQPVSAVSVELREHDGFVVTNPKDISPDNRDLHRWLSRVASAGMSRR